MKTPLALNCVSRLKQGRMGCPYFDPLEHTRLSQSTIRRRTVFQMFAAYARPPEPYQSISVTARVTRSTFLPPTSNRL